MICRKTSITACAFVVTVALMPLLLAGGAGAAPVEEWNKTFGIEVSGIEALSVQQTSDGGYLLAGAPLIKTDANGNLQWSKVAISAQQTSDRGYILARPTSSSVNGYNVLLIKADANGDQQWERTFEGIYIERPYFVKQTSDDGYIIAGNTEKRYGNNEAVLLIKTDTKGNEQWRKTFTGESDINVFSIHLTSDDGYILAGIYYHRDRPGDAWLMKADKNGIKQWEKTFKGREENKARSAHQTSDKGYILAGGDGKAWLIKTDENGNQIWKRTFGAGDAFSVQQTLDSGYTIAGINDEGSGEAWLIKVDENGNEQWNKTFKGKYGSGGAKSVQQTSDGDYIIAGYTKEYMSARGDVMLIKIKDTGESSKQSKDKAGTGKILSEDSPPDINKPVEKSTPGFEMSGAIISVAMILFLKRKRA